MTSYQGSEELLARMRDLVAEHIHTYVSSQGQAGHIVDLSSPGARGLMPTLLLQTIGRKSGRRLIVPLIYGVFGGEWVVVGSKGGSPTDPAWYLNLQAQSEVSFQVATQAFRATWREAQGEEREKVWEYMAHHFPPYPEYQKSAGRLIPLIMLRPVAESPLFEAEGG